MLCVDIMAVAALIVTAYAGNLSPVQHGGLWGVMPLCFPGVLAIVVALLVLHLFWLRKGAVITALGLLACAAPVLNFCPLHILTPKIPEGAETFTLMTYNAHQFVLPGTTNNEYDTINNPTLEYILKQDADIVALQEAAHIGTINRYYLTRDQLNRLHERYAYVHTDCEELVLLSKFPVEGIHLETNNRNFNGGLAACYRVTLPSGRRITLFNVHLQSMQLSDDARDIVVDISKGERESLSMIENQVIRKIALAGTRRARQVLQLMRYIRLYGGPEVIVTGDFNDVPGCYAIRTLYDAGFKSVYPSLGFGPLITFNDKRLYFCIDHTLWRGSLHPVKMVKGRLRTSDHYPLTTTFYTDKKTVSEM